MKRPARGFSLLEVLVAFVILALSLGVLMRIFSGGLNNVGRAERHAHAVVLAESRLAALGVEAPLEEGENAGETEQGYQWRTLVRRYEGAQGDLDPQSMPIELFQVAVMVSWSEGGERPGQVVLASLRAAPRQ